MTVKVSDWIAQKLVDEGISNVFMVTGGGAMHLNHSIGTHPALCTTFCHHEQALSMAAESYYRLNNKLAVLNVTSGPGGTNAITGVYGAWTDSIGMLVVSGQVKIETTVRSTGLPLRQYGDQELDIEELVRPITKYAVMVTDPLSIRHHLEKAIYLARTGRPGPCWLDVPLDVQAARIDPDALLPGFDPAELDEPWKRTDLAAAAKAILEKVAAAERPVIMVGTGVRLSGGYADFLRFAEKLGVPVVTAFNARDVLWHDHPLYAGYPGTVGDRAGNMVTQSSDLLLILGCRLNIRQISYNWSTFAREAYKIWVDIDPVELQKPTVVPNMPVVADLAALLKELDAQPYAGPTAAHKEWLQWSKARLERFPTVLPEYHENVPLQPYVAMEGVLKALGSNDIIVTANATACVVSFQVAKIKQGQRMWSNSGAASMGYDLPAAIGACVAAGGKQRVICFAGDGSIMMNIQELQTIAGNGMPIKIFLFNNNGYVSIFQTHRNFFNGVEVGSGPKSNVTFPKFSAVAQAFGLAYHHCAGAGDLDAAVAATLAEPGPAICEIMIDEHAVFAPKLSSKQHPDGRITSPALEDMSPFLARDELAENMRIALLDD